MTEKQNVLRWSRYWSIALICVCSLIFIWLRASVDEVAKEYDAKLAKDNDRLAPTDAEANKRNKELDPVIRKAMAQSVQDSYRRKGIKITVQARGTTFYASYPLATEADVSAFEQDLQKARGSLRRAGFTKVVFRGHDDYTWTWNLSEAN